MIEHFIPPDEVPGSLCSGVKRGRVFVQMRTCRPVPAPALPPLTS
jgi:hypothetical protein